MDPNAGLSPKPSRVEGKVGSSGTRTCAFPCIECLQGSHSEAPKPLRATQIMHISAWTCSSDTPQKLPCKTKTGKTHRYICGHQLNADTVDIFEGKYMLFTFLDFHYQCG